MRLLSLFAAALLILLAAAPSALAKPPLEAFGDVPSIRAMDLSPDGKRVAYIQRKDGEDVLVIFDLATSTARGLARVSDIRARYVQFISDTYVVLVASKDTRTFGYSGRYEFSAAFAFDVSTAKYVQLLARTPDIYPAQSGLGRIIGVAPDGRNVFMPAFMASAQSNPDYDLLRVSLESGRGFRHDGGNGNSNTIDWITNNDGKVVLREDFSDKQSLHQVRTRQPNGDWKTIYENRTSLPEVGIVAMSEDGQSVIAINSGDSKFRQAYTLPVAGGEMAGPVFQRKDADIAAVITDTNRIARGVEYSGMYPTYDMFDKAIEDDIRFAQEQFGASAVFLTGWSQDWSRLLFHVSGGKYAERYAIMDRPAHKVAVIANARPLIKTEDVGEVAIVNYKARDGLTIPGLVTWPVGVAEADRKNLPLVVLPHGGPASYDSVGFDWIAQYLANEGYAVLQPNFRGSTGLGADFATAGYGQWGRKMQDDITDGANALVKMGWADPNRMCIVGWSYGGYAALAGGASTPDLYKCVASVAGVSDLAEMLRSERYRHGPNSSTVTYWEMLIGDLQTDREAINAVSPALHADKVKAPVLLVHGAADTTVPIRQSELMNDALKRANKSVEFVSIPGDDHGLVDNDSRRLMLTKLGEFLKTHIGK